MKGQWIGEFKGSSEGTIVVNVDERESHYQGVAYLFQHDKSLPNSAAFIQTPNKHTPVTFRTNFIRAIHPTSGEIVEWDIVKGFYPGNVTFSHYADAQATWDAESLSLSWSTDNGATGSAVMPRSRAGQLSDLVPLKRDWRGYKEHVASLAPSRHLFRGQSRPWRLRSAFHRAGRSDLYRFVLEDIPALHRHISARTRHIFNLQIPDENGAFLNLVQHHGYPTPLLDWTYSPYVAAFFAYTEISNEDAAQADGDAAVRIFVFDQERWRQNVSQILQLLSPGLHVSVAEFIAIENERMVPQQSASTVTNVDDIESYIRSLEPDGRTYLSAIDLPVRDRKNVMWELSYMGITAGSLFPGLDGACAEMAERHFGK